MAYPAQSKLVLIGAETAWGTETSVSNDPGMIISDVSDNLSREVIESLGISNIETQKVTTGLLDVGLTMTGDYQHGRMFRYIIGTASASPTSNDDTHDFFISDNPESLTIESANNLTTDESLVHTGMLVETAELSIALNENLKLSTTLKGKTTKSKPSASAAITSTLAVFPHALCSVKINSVAATEIQNASITVTKVVQRSGGISSNLFQQGHGTEMKFGFSATLGFQSNIYNNLFLAGTTSTPTSTVSPSSTADPTSSTFELSATNGVTLGSGLRKIELILTSCQFSTFDKITTVGSLTFIDIAGVGTFSSLSTVDDITTL